MQCLQQRLESDRELGRRVRTIEFSGVAGETTHSRETGLSFLKTCQRR